MTAALSNARCLAKSKKKRYPMDGDLMTWHGGILGEKVLRSQRGCIMFLFRWAKTKDMFVAQSDVKWVVISFFYLGWRLVMGKWAKDGHFNY